MTSLPEGILLLSTLVIVVGLILRAIVEPPAA